MSSDRRAIRMSIEDLPDHIKVKRAKVIELYCNMYTKAYIDLRAIEIGYDQLIKEKK